MMKKQVAFWRKKPEFDIEKLFITERNAHKEKKKNNIFVRLEIIHQHHLSSKRTTYREQKESNPSDVRPMLQKPVSAADDDSLDMMMTEHTAAAEQFNSFRWKTTWSHQHSSSVSAINIFMIFNLRTTDSVIRQNQCEPILEQPYLTG